MAILNIKRNEKGQFIKGFISPHKGDSNWVNSGSFKKGHKFSQKSLEKMSIAKKGKRGNTDSLLLWIKENGAWNKGKKMGPSPHKGKHWSKRHLRENTKKCEFCGREFKIKYSEQVGYFNKRRFCSQRCFWLFMNEKYPGSRNTGRTHFKKGMIPWNKGLVGYGGFNKGKTNSKETREKISLALKRKYTWSKEERERLKQIGLKGRIKQQNMKGPTSIEKKVYEELKARGFLFEKQKLINGKFLVDAYIPSLNLIIEADGDYWHSLPKTVKKDKAENAYLTKCGYNLLRLSEKEINDNSFKNILNKRKVN